jgi:hypothetical protein
MLSQRQLTGKYAVKNCGVACAEWDFKTNGGDNFFSLV